MKIAQIVGARPQFVKLAPVSRAIERAVARGERVEEFVLHTGQHYDANVSDVFFTELRLPAPTSNLGVGSGSHGVQTARMLEKLEAEFQSLRPDVVVVYGDTNSTLAGALAATKLGIRTVHVEAGLRSFNRAMPEELNRVAVDHLSDLLLAPTTAAMRHLADEGLAARSRMVGDLMCDAVLEHSRTARESSTALERFGLAAGAYAVATIHRAESTSPAVLAALLDGLARAARRLVPVILPLHPRTRAVIAQHSVPVPDASLVRIVDPVGYLDMLRLVDSARLVLTDSGGLQKETFILGTPCVTLRSETEWVETVESGANTIAGLDPAAIVAGAERMAALGAERSRWREKAAGLYGGGRAADAVLASLVG